MELKNDAQDKKFLADRTSIHKQANVRTFSVHQNSPPKQFVGTKQLPSPEYGTENFAERQRKANASSPNQIVNAQRQIATRPITDVRTVHDSNRIAQSGEFAGERPFLDKGKSQKSLSQPTKPMTIDEIRELLNKNK